MGRRPGLTIDVSLDSDEALEERAQLKHHPAVKAAIQELWGATPKAPAPHDVQIDRQIYVWLSLRILSHIPDGEGQGLVPTIIEDWWKESEGEFFMDYDRFFAGIFQYVDLWCPAICAKKYARHIKALAKSAKAAKVTFSYSMRVAERHWAEWMEREDRQREVTATSPVEFPYAAMRRKASVSWQGGDGTGRLPRVSSYSGRRRSRSAMSGSSGGIMSVPSSPCSPMPAVPNPAAAGTAIGRPRFASAMDPPRPRRRGATPKRSGSCMALPRHVPPAKGGLSSPRNRREPRPPLLPMQPGKVPSPRATHTRRATLLMGMGIDLSKDDKCERLLPAVTRPFSIRSVVSANSDSVCGASGMPDIDARTVTSADGDVDSGDEHDPLDISVTSVVVAPCAPALGSMRAAARRDAWQSMSFGRASLGAAAAAAVAAAGREESA